ncbi:hypothetical protein TNCV_5093391 [Trichonephila clavipes]|nr:hypothetical protein TNCV_5093391 [Trichonephila clavipes]
MSIDTFFGSRAQSAEECPADAHIEFIGFQRKNAQRTDLLLPDNREKVCGALGSPPIPINALWIANGNFLDISSFVKEINKNLELAAISSTFVWGKTRPYIEHVNLPGHSRLGSIERENNIFRGSAEECPADACMSPPTTESTREAVCGRLFVKSQAEGALPRKNTPKIYCCNIRARDTTGKPAEECHPLSAGFGIYGLILQLH